MENIDGIVYTPIGWTTDENIINQINNDFDNGYLFWLNENQTELQNGNLSILDYLTNNDVYLIDTETDYLPENLNEIIIWH